MSDDDPTPPFGRQATWWTDTQRSSTAADRARRERSYGMPVVMPPVELRLEPVTDTFDLVDREPSQAALAVMQRSKRDSEDKATFKDIVNLAEELRRTQRAPSAEIEAMRVDLHDLKRDAGVARWIVRGLVVGSVGAFLFVAERVWSRAELEGRDRAERDSLKHTVEEIRQDLRALTRGKDK